MGCQQRTIANSRNTLEYGPTFNYRGGLSCQRECQGKLAVSTLELSRVFSSTYPAEVALSRSARSLSFNAGGLGSVVPENLYMYTHPWPTLPSKMAIYSWSIPSTHVLLCLARYSQEQKTCSFNRGCHMSLRPGRDAPSLRWQRRKLDMRCKKMFLF